MAASPSSCVPTEVLPVSLKPLKKTDRDKPWAKVNDRMSAKRPERRYILVVSEDEKSSVYYFDEFSKMLKANAATIGVKPQGCGRNTQSLVKYARENLPRWLAKVQEDVDIEDFDEVWILFDKDDFPDYRFDNAVKSAEKQGFVAGWSNECFELWYLLHAQDQVSAIGRRGIYPKLRSLHEADKNYETDLKGESGEAFHRMMAHHPSVRVALRRAKKLDAERDHSAPPSRSNPCTKVYGLVEKLLPYVKT